MIEPVGFPIGFYIALALLGIAGAYAWKVRDTGVGIPMGAVLLEVGGGDVYSGECGVGSVLRVFFGDDVGSGSVHGERVGYFAVAGAGGEVFSIRSSRFAHDPCFVSEVADGGELLADWRVAPEI